MQFRAFTTYGQGPLNVLKNQVGITAAGSNSLDPKYFLAVWDTGATTTVITSRAVEECELKQTGMIELHGVHGSETTPTYLVNIFLPNNVRVLDLKVAQAPLTGDADVLVGMDIIRMGDFAVSSYENKTSFSFRVPSEERVDFLPQEARRSPLTQIHSHGKVGRNTPCPCGSGKKYKKCCGRN